MRARKIQITLNRGTILSIIIVLRQFLNYQSTIPRSLRDACIQAASGRSKVDCTLVRGDRCPGLLNGPPHGHTFSLEASVALPDLLRQIAGQRQS